MMETTFKAIREGKEKTLRFSRYPRWKQMPEDAKTDEIMHDWFLYWKEVGTALRQLATDVRYDPWV